jgi:hypothetical protein
MEDFLFIAVVVTGTKMKKQSQNDEPIDKDVEIDTSWCFK